jgi:protoporphyrinogen oxidase
LNTLIVGSGISGTAAGNILKSKDYKYRMFEGKSRTGGLVHCEVVNGYLYHRVGGHVFNSKVQRVLDWFWPHFNRDEEFLKVERNAKIYLEEKYIGYPIENHLYQIDRSLAKGAIDDLLTCSQKDNVRHNNFKSFLSNTFGPTLCDLYFFPYNEKIWGLPLDEVSIDWLEGKLPIPDVSSVFYDNIFRKKEENMVHSTFYYPKKGGSQFVIDRLGEGLVIETGVEVSDINLLDNQGIKVLDTYYSNLIYTGDIRRLADIIKTDSKSLSNALLDVQSLPSHGTSNILCECDPTDISWLYLPDSSIKAHRIIYTGGFSKNNNGDSTRMSCVVEFSGEVNINEMEVELEKLPGNLKPIASNYEKNSYIIHDNNSNEKVAEAKAELEKFGVFLLGRFAEWQYYNMDKAIESAMYLIDRLEVDNRL